MARGGGSNWKLAVTASTPRPRAKSTASVRPQVPTGIGIVPRHPWGKKAALRSQIKLFELLTEALVSNHLVEFDYFSLRANKPELRQVAPYHLACINNQWYLIGADQSRAQLRTFALTRIANVKDRKVPFDRPADFSVAKMLAGSFAAFQAARTEHVKIRFDAFAARLVRERQWHKSQKMRPADDGGMELTMRVGLAPDLENWILGWGEHAEVIEPVELRRRICTTIRKMAAKYQVTARERYRRGSTAMLEGEILLA